MKTSLLLLAIYLLIMFIPQKLAAQTSKESEIRQLEDLARRSVMNSDSTILYTKLWSPDLVVNNPANVVIDLEGVTAQVRSGNLKYQSFDRMIERITFHDNIAVVMGEEKIKPQGKQPYAGKLVTRRFTNVWKNENKQWRLIARQATIVKVE